MGKTLQDLNLIEETLPTAGQALDDLPQFGSFAPPPQPGLFRFKLPMDLSGIWDTMDSDHKTAADPKGTRVVAVFDQNAPLTIVQSHTNNRYKGETFQTRLNNNERKRGKDGAGGVHSDLDYLCAAFDPKIPKPTSNKGYIERIRTFAGREFNADIRWSWACSKSRNIRVKDPAGAIIEVENKPGCGNKYYQDDIPANLKLANGEFPLEISCSCGALLRAFGNVDNIKGDTK
jgi:hypothetical protein